MSESYHFIGIGGIGMSGLAAMCRDLGGRVTGSDRGAERPENRRILDALELQGITIFPQDGSFIHSGERPDYLVYSTAIEEDNPDFAAGTGIPRLHRSELLASILSTGRFKSTIAVTGSCGKSTVTAYTAEALTNLGADPCCLNGALSKRFRGGRFAGNYRAGGNEYFVFEADESDKSLLNYTVDYAVILNIGTDHYDREELARVFAGFLQRVRRGAVIERGVYEAIGEAAIPAGLKIAVFDAEPRGGTRYALAGYNMETRLEMVYRYGRRSPVRPGADRDEYDREGANNILAIQGLRSEEFRIERRVPTAEFTDGRRVELPHSGLHMAINALAITALLDMLGFDFQAIPEALERFDGVWRRNDFAGTTRQGALVYDDYAHNPEKIISCLRAMRELASGNLYAVFQPHGYGPFGFMRDELFIRLDSELRALDRFILLEPYYAGGTTSFRPTAPEVLADWQSRSRRPERFMFFPDRETLRDFLLLKCGSGDLIVTMGARDNSLSDYAASLTEPVNAG